MIAVVGSLNIDIVARVARFPMPGETVSATSYQESLGGKGANQAVAAARAGSAVEFVGRVGADRAGDALRVRLDESGVDTTHVTQDSGGSSGSALIAVDNRGENTIIVIPGVNANLQPADVQAASEVIERCSILLLQLEIPLETVQYAAALAQSTGTTVILNPSPSQELPSSLLDLVDILVPNEEEVGYLTGMGSPVDPTSAAGMLCSNGVKAVVITLGRRGAAIVDGNGETDIHAYDVDVIDSTGAGDAFVGNLAAALDAGQSLAEAAQFASAAAALSVQAAGAQSSMPSKAETETFIARMEAS
jgi:ribokinase